MCGDGLTDWVRLRNGELCYGANLGYGRFGAKVTMDCKPSPLVERRYRPVGNEVYAREDATFLSRGRPGIPPPSGEGPATRGLIPSSPSPHGQHRSRAPTLDAIDLPGRRVRLYFNQSGIPLE